MLLVEYATGSEIEITESAGDAMHGGYYQTWPCCYFSHQWNIFKIKEMLTNDNIRYQTKQKKTK